MKTSHLITGGVAAAVLLALPPTLKSYGVYMLSYWLVYVIAVLVFPVVLFL